MKRQREFLAVTIILAAALFSTGAQASRSTIEGGMLYVPRIDVDGFGALELTFRIVYDGEYQLLLEAADQASQAISSSGVFDPVALTIDVDEIELESGDLYAVQLVLMSQDPQVVFGIGNATHLNPQQNDPPNSGSQDPDPQAVSQYNQLCAGCHAVDGSGTAVAPSLSACSNCGSVSGLSNYIRDTMPLGNAGGCDSACASLLADYIMLAFNGSNQQVSTQTIGFIQTMGNGDALRRAAQQLVSRLPTLAEFQLAATGTDGLRSAVQGMMTEDGFYDRLAEIFNDYLLTDKYHSRNGSDHAIRLLSRDEFPSLYWFDPDKNNRSENFEDVRRATNNGVAREPLALINHVVRNNLPFTEILTADYFMVNPFSAKSYGVENQVAFSDPNNPDEFRPARLQDIPHAGVLTSPMFLNRYPTTETNRNRGRARVVFDLFLDTDILAIEGVRPGNAVDITTPIPTINNPQCSKCHSVLDPVASIFQNWDYKGRYRPSRESKHGWYTDMEPRGFNGEVMPLAGNVDSSVRWLAARMAQDPKFPRAVTRILVNGLTGKEPLQAPSDGDQLAMDAYVAERTLLNDMQSDFVAEGYNLKSLVTEIVLSPYWRAAGLTSDANTVAHAETGASYLLSPEQLDRKIEMLLGFDWRYSMDSYYKDKDKSWASKLGSQFFQIYGGIDSDSITTRLRSPNGMMGAMQLRMANELSCYAVPHDFWLPESQRRLFLYVDHEMSPYSDAGTIDESVLALIRENMIYLHEYLLGEHLTLQSAELQVTETLFMNVLNRGRQILLNNAGEWWVTRLPSDCDRTRDLNGEELLSAETAAERGHTGPVRLQQDRQYVIRAWMAVVAYLLADYRFLYS